VLLAMGRDDEAARGSLRFSLGHTSSEADVDALVEAIGPAVERARAAGIASGLGASKRLAG
jgi:cysteine desulfurase